MTTHQYKVIVTPTSASPTVWAELRCIYSISIGNGNRPVGDVLDGLAWTAAHFPVVAILIGDSLYAVTLRIQRGLDATAAIKTAMDMADDVLRLIEPRAGRLEVFRTSRFQADPRFLEIEAQIEAALQSTPAFAQSVHADARLFVSRQAKHQRLALNVEKAEALARHYLVREIAAYAYLASMGWRVDTYLGHELPTLAGIMNGSIPPVSQHLACRMNISLVRKDKSL